MDSSDNDVQCGRGEIWRKIRERSRMLEKGCSVVAAVVDVVVVFQSGSKQGWLAGSLVLVSFLG